MRLEDPPSNLEEARRNISLKIANGNPDLKQAFIRRTKAPQHDEEQNADTRSLWEKMADGTEYLNPN